MYPSTHWPATSYEKAYHNAIYNCIQYELSDGEYTVVCADAKGIHAIGDSAEDAIADFREAVETRIIEKKGGIYLGTSDFRYQENIFRELERGWEEDGVLVVNRVRISVQIFIHPNTTE